MTPNDALLALIADLRLTIAERDAEIAHLKEALEAALVPAAEEKSGGLSR